MYPNSITYDGARWLFCGYYDGGLRTRKLANSSIPFVILRTKTLYFKREEAVEMQRKWQLELRMLR